MALAARLQEDLKGAMRSGDAVRRDALRMALAALKNRRIELGHDLEEPDELAVLAKEVKSREDSASQYEEAGRAELAERERAEIAILEAYLPEQLSEEEVRSLVRETIAAVGAASKKDLGKVMKAVMAEHRGQVDGRLVQRLAAEELG